MRFNPYPYQQRAVRWVLEHPRCCLFLDMGLGKSVITLTAVEQLIADGDVEKVLVVAPKKVAETTWSDEVRKWDHLSGLSVSVILGTSQQRRAAMAAEADIYVTSRDLFVWLLNEHGGRIPYQMVVLDELTSFKTPNSLRSKAMRKLSPMLQRVVGLTGTPAPNGLIDLWAQMYCVDMGERLGKFVSRYREKYFSTYVRNNIAIRCDPLPGARGHITGLISDICLTMQASDYLQLPDMIVQDVPINLQKKDMDRYWRFERDNVMSIDGETITADSAAALMNKLQQFANGQVYDEAHNVTEIHGEKLERLKEIVEASDSPVLGFYQFRSDIPRILEAMESYRVTVYKDAEDLRRWNDGEFDLLLAHPASTAYGLNMQQGGSVIVWYGTGWNLELYQQANARLHRQGQTRPVRVLRLITRGTVDENAAAAIDSKRNGQQAMIDNLKRLMEKYGKGQDVQETD